MAKNGKKGPKSFSENAYFLFLPSPQNYIDIYYLIIICFFSLRKCMEENSKKCTKSISK